MKAKSELNVIMAFLLCLVFYFNNETLSNNLCTFVDQPTKYVYALLFVYFIATLISKPDKHLKIYAEKLAIIVLLFLFTITAYYFDSGFSNGYILLALAVLCGIIISKNVSFRDFSILYVKYMVVMSLCSLAGSYLIKYIAPYAGGIIPVERNSAGTTFYNMYLCYVHTGITYYRNTGIFREPGVFAIFLCIAFMLLVLNKKEYEHKDFQFCSVILIITLVSTFSTTGYLGFFVVLIWLCLKRDINLKILLVAGIIIFGASVFTNIAIENPLLKLSNDSSSFRYRAEPILNGAVLVIHKPLGYGILRGINSLASMSTLRYYNNTSTFVGIGVYLGLPFLLIVILGLLKFCKRRLKSSLLFFSFIILLNGELLIYNPILYILVMYGYTKVYPSITEE